MNVEVDGNVGDDFQEKRSESDSLTATPPRSSSDSAMDKSSPIVYHYLTFETPLLHPSPRPSNNITTTEPPPQPNLKKFTSPFEWPESRKRLTIWLSCIATMITAFTAGSYAPPSQQMSAEWHVSELAIAVGITTFCAGFATYVHLIPTSHRDY